jgi:hypothetical protein
MQLQIKVNETVTKNGQLLTLNYQWNTKPNTILNFQLGLPVHNIHVMYCGTTALAYIAHETYNHVDNVNDYYFEDHNAYQQRVDRPFNLSVIQFDSQVKYRIKQYSRYHELEQAQSVAIRLVKEYFNNTWKGMHFESIQ